MPATPHPDQPMFFTGDVCRAVGIEQSTLKNWITRGAILMSDDDRKRFGVDGPSHERLASGSGRSHLFTLRRVVQIALTAELVALGLPPLRAAMLALGFTDVGDGGGGWVGEPIELGRLPGQLYKDGLTLLVAYPEEESSHVINVDPKTPLYEVLFRGARQHKALLLVNVADVCSRVSTALDVVYPT